MKHITTYCLLLVGLLITGVAFGQSKKELIELGDKAFEKGNYASAAYFYDKVVNGSSGKYDLTLPYEVNAWSGQKNAPSDSENPENVSPAERRNQYAVHRLAESYRHLRDYEHAVLWYSKAAQMPNEQFPQARYWYGTMLMTLEKYQQASDQFDKFMQENGESDPFHKYAQDKQVSCEFAVDPNNVNQEANLMLLDSTFNRGTANFGVAYYEGDMSVSFTSGRDGNYVDGPKRKQAKYMADLFVSTNLGDGYDAPVRLEAPINSGMHEGSGALSVDRTTFYFTRWNDDNKQSAHIYATKKFNNRWMQPMELDEKINVAGFRSLNPFLSLDETKIYFASDRPGGYGGLDIWYCPIDPFGNIGNPVNLGPTVNTKEDEMSPFEHFQSKTLFFSSKGHIGFGGYDIFRTQYDEDNDVWSNPVNIGGPYNSSKDDTYFIIDKNLKNGFLTSDRERCSDCDSTLISGYCNKIYGFVKPDIKMAIEGYVYDNQTNEIIPNALITFKDIKSGFAPFFVMTDDEGYYYQDLEHGMDIFMKAQKSKYFGDAATVFTSTLTESTVLQQDFFLNQIPDGEMVIEGIEYDFDKATLRPKSKEILDELYKFIELNNDLVLEIQSHTDSRGSDAYNLKLSQQRAQSVVDYLVTKGVTRDRLIPKGYGESTPAPVLDANGRPMKDEQGESIRYTEKYINALPTDDARETAHQKNRRTAFKVLSQSGDTMIETNNQ